MFYNQYYGYQPPMSDMRQQYQMQQPQNMVPTNISAPAADNRVWVQGRGAAEAYLVAPNSFVILWDSTRPVFYKKTADGSGRPSMKEYIFNENVEVKREEKGINIESIETRFEEITKRLEKLEGARKPKKEAVGDE